MVYKAFILYQQGIFVSTKFQKIILFFTIKMETIQQNRRIESIDLLRGIVIIIMTLDHVRDFFHADAYLFDPTDLSKTNPLLFLTRIITHYCAPIFIFLAGTSAYQVGQKKGISGLSSYLLKRGIWLIILELTVMNIAWFFNPNFGIISFQVIGAIGLSMVLLSAIVYLPMPWIIAGSLIMIFGHNLLDGITIKEDNFQAFIWSLIHQQRMFNWIPDHVIYIGYPVVPWVGVMALGYAFGVIYTAKFKAEERRKILLTYGWLSIVLFIIIRSTNLYGDTRLWDTHASGINLLLSFINVSKYPPSLLYILLTIGPALLLLAFLENAKGVFWNKILVYGKVSMFYYILHIYIIHTLAMLAASLTGFGADAMVLNTWVYMSPRLQGYGFSLSFVYLLWIVIVVATYPICRWYGAYKNRHQGYWWLSYV